MHFVFLAVVKFLKDNFFTGHGIGRDWTGRVSFPIFLIVFIFYLKRSCYV